MHALDDFSERRLRDIAGDKEAGQSLSKEALKLSKEDIFHRLMDGSIKPTDALMARVSAFMAENARAHRVFDAVNGQVINGQRRDLQNAQRSNDRQPRVQAQKQTQAFSADAQRTVETQHRVEAQQKAEAQRTAEMQQRMEAQQKVEAERTAENQQRIETQKRTEVQTKTETEKLEAERKSETERLEQTKTDTARWTPGMFDGINWKRDNAGNFVTMDRSGRLLTRDDNGKLVDYESQLNQKYMANQDQMAFTSILFCNPLMLLGIGAGFFMMDQRHGANTKGAIEVMKGKFNGKNSRGYVSDLTRKALLVCQPNRSLTDATQMNGLAGFNQARLDREEAARRRKRLASAEERMRRAEGTRRAEDKMSLSAQGFSADRYSLTTEKLIKHKRRLQEHIEKVRGKATLQEMSQLYLQMELLDRALKRLSNLAM